MLPEGLSVRHDLSPVDVSAIVEMHRQIYRAEYGWDDTFADYVEGPLSAFATSHGAGEKIWIVEQGRDIVATIAIVSESPGRAQLRWLLLAPSVRGIGLGTLLLQEAVRFSRDQGYDSIVLWTVDALVAAARLYRAAGFRVVEAQTQEIWGTTLTEQRYTLDL